MVYFTNYCTRTHFFQFRNTQSSGAAADLLCCLPCARPERRCTFLGQWSGPFIAHCVRCASKSQVWGGGGAMQCRKRGHIPLGQKREKGRKKRKNDSTKVCLHVLLKDECLLKRMRFR